MRLLNFFTCKYGISCLIKGLFKPLMSFCFHPNKTFWDFWSHFAPPGGNLHPGYPPFQVFPNELNISQLKTSHPLTPSLWEYHTFLIFS